MLLRNIKNGAPRAISRALNRAAQGAKSKIPAQVASDYTMKRGDVSKTLSIRRASVSKLEAEIKSRGVRIPLGRFAHRPHRDTTGSKRRQVTAEVTKGSKSDIVRGFLWHNRIFRRPEPHGREITEEYGPAAPNLVARPEIEQNTTEIAQKRFEERLDHEIEALLKGYTK